MPDSSLLCLRLIPVFLSFNLQYAAESTPELYTRQKHEPPLRGHKIMSKIDGCIS